MHKNKQWFNKEYLLKRKELRLITKALNLNSNDSRSRQTFCNLKRHYIGLYRKLKWKHEQEILCKLENNYIKWTQKSSWKLLRHVKADRGKALQNQHELPPLEESLNYFKALLEKQTPEFPVKEIQTLETSEPLRTFINPSILKKSNVD